MTGPTSTSPFRRSGSEECSPLVSEGAIINGTLCIFPHVGRFRCGLTDPKKDTRKNFSRKACKATRGHGNCLKMMHEVVVLDTVGQVAGRGLQ